MAGVAVLLAGWFALSAWPSVWSCSNTGDNCGSESNRLLLGGPEGWLVSLIEVDEINVCPGTVVLISEPQEELLS